MTFIAHTFNQAQAFQIQGFFMHARFKQLEGKGPRLLCPCRLFCYGRVLVLVLVVCCPSAG